MYVLMNKKVI